MRRAGSGGDDGVEGEEAMLSQAGRGRHRDSVRLRTKKICIWLANVGREHERWVAKGGQGARNSASPSVFSSAARDGSRSAALSL